MTAVVRNGGAVPWISKVTDRGLHVDRFIIYYAFPLSYHRYSSTTVLQTAALLSSSKRGSKSGEK